MIRKISKNVRSRRGTTAVEYAIMLSLIVLACIGSLQILGQNTRQTFFQIGTSLMSVGPKEVGAPVVGEGPAK